MTPQPKSTVVLLDSGTDGTSRERTCEVNRMGENSSFIFTCYVKTVSIYDFKLVLVVLHPPVKEFFKTIY